MRIFVAREPLDFRRGIDGTAEACRKVLQQDPFSGAAFVFKNRAATMIRVLVYDGQGYVVATKRLSSGRFKHWDGFDKGQPSVAVAAHQLQLLAAGGHWSRARGHPPWRPVT